MSATCVSARNRKITKPTYANKKENIKRADTQVRPYNVKTSPYSGCASLKKSRRAGLGALEGFAPELEYALELARVVLHEIRLIGPVGERLVNPQGLNVREEKIAQRIDGV